jgi:hypothetical protein
LYSSPDIIRQIKSRRMRGAGHVARMGEGRNVYRVLVGKPEGKRPIEGPRRKRDYRLMKVNIASHILVENTKISKYRC